MRWEPITDKHRKNGTTGLLTVGGGVTHGWYEIVKKEDGTERGYWCLGCEGFGTHEEPTHFMEWPKPAGQEVEEPNWGLYQDMDGRR